MLGEFTSTDFAATLKSARLRDGPSKSISMRPSNDLNSPVVLGQPIASTQKTTWVWDGSIFQDDRACAATAAATSARAGPEKAESGGDSQAARVMIHPAGWEEASL